MLNKQCGHRFPKRLGKSYTFLAAALAACNEDPQCGCVDDQGCDGYKKIFDSKEYVLYRETKASGGTFARNDCAWVNILAN